jgi:hypothetical protein
VRRAFFGWSLGLAEEQLGNLTQAEEAYATAAATPGLDPATQSTYDEARERVRRARAPRGPSA